MTLIPESELREDVSKGSAMLLVEVLDRINKYHRLKGSVQEVVEGLEEDLPEQVRSLALHLLDTFRVKIQDEARAALDQQEAEVINAYRRSRTEAVPQAPDYTALPVVLARHGNPVQNGRVWAAAVLGIGLTSSLMIPQSWIGKLVGVGATLVASGAAYKFVYHAALQMVIDTLKAEVEVYLGKTEDEVYRWLLGIARTYEEHFDNFCKENDLQLKKRE